MEFWVYVGIIAGIYTVLSLGLYLQFGLAGLPNFGIVAFMALAAYTMAILIIRFSVSWPVAVVAGLVVAAGLGTLLLIPALRLRADYLAIATVAVGEIVRYLAVNLTDLTGGAAGSIGMLGQGQIAQYNQPWVGFLNSIRNSLPTSVGQGLTNDDLVLVIVWVLAGIFLLAFTIMARSPWGRVLKAIREDESAAAASGKNVLAYKLQVLVLGAVLAGLAGVLLAFEVGTFSPDDFNPTLTFYAYLIVILGGLTRIAAIPVGAVLFGLLYSGTRFLGFYPLSLIDSGSRAYLRLMLVGALLILFMALRPQGLLGNRKELHLV